MATKTSTPAASPEPAVEPEPPPTTAEMIPMWNDPIFDDPPAPEPTGPDPREAWKSITPAGPPPGIPPRFLMIAGDLVAVDEIARVELSAAVHSTQSIRIHFKGGVLPKTLHNGAEADAVRRFFTEGPGATWVLKLY